MSKFRRVSELTTPEYLNKAVDGSFEGDPYANLKKSSAQRRQKIAKNTQDYKITKSDTPYDWEKVLSQENYQDHKFPINEKEVHANSLGSNHRIVRKAEYLYDEEFTARDPGSQLKPFTPEQYTQALLKGASIWNPDMDDIAEAFKNSQLSDSEAAMANNETREIIRASKHERWEKNSVDNLKKSKYSTARANPLLKTQNEMPVDLQHGMIDWSELDSREQQKLAMREKRRKATQQIKSVGRSREEVHQSWEDDLELGSNNIKDYYSSNGIDLNID
jgi:hypothetical protein